ncbi:MAG: hypothetical protein K2Q14_05000 [Gammaproteobacteria bacterium]|nr:hypothetical protein [Gammaproteobacteria bacterium]
MTKMTHQNNFFALLLLSGFMLLLSGCGFHLRSNPPLPSNLHEMAIQSASPYGKLTQLLTSILTQMGVNIIPAIQKPPLTLVIDSEAFSSNSYTQSSSSSTEQYIMYYTIIYHLANAKGVSIFGPKVVRLAQQYSLNQNQVLSTDSVEQSVQSQMQQDAVYQIITQLGSTDAQVALKSINSSPPPKPKSAS